MIAAAPASATPSLPLLPTALPGRTLPPRAVALGLLALIGGLAVMADGLAGACVGPGLDVAAVELPKVAPAACRLPPA